MVVALVLGFLVVTCGAVRLRSAGRRAAATVVVVGLIPVLLVVSLTVGREGVGELFLGALLGLPVLLAATWAQERQERRGAPETAGAVRPSLRRR